MQKIKQDKNKIKHNFSEKHLNDEQFKRLCETFFNSKESKTKETKKLKSILTEEQILKLEEKAKKNNFYYLHSFLSLNKEKIVISQTSFYKRFLSNKNIIQYLIDKDYIYCYKSIKHQYKDNNKSEKIHFIVNYQLAKEFAQILHNSFLTNQEKGVEIVKRKRNYKKK